MAGKKKEEITIIVNKINTKITVQKFCNLWNVFDINPTQFLNYILTRIQIETERRKSKSRHPSLIFKPIPQLPTGVGNSDSDDTSSDFDSDSDEDYNKIDNNNMVVIDDETLEDIQFEIAAT
eukprot:163874_1